MGIPRPTGGYIDQLLEPHGWPDVDEDVFYDRANDFRRVLQGVTDVLDTCRQQRTQVFDGGLWSGTAAGSADGELRSRVEQLVTLQDRISGVVNWHDQLAGAILAAKLTITDNVDLALRQIAILADDPTLEADARTTAINTVLLSTHGANAGVVVATAEQILATKPTPGSGDLLPRPGDWLNPPVADIAGPDTPAVTPTPETQPGNTEPGTAPDSGAEPGQGTAPATPGQGDTPPTSDTGGGHTPDSVPTAPGTTPGAPATPGTTPGMPTTPEATPGAPGTSGPVVLPPISAPSIPAAAPSAGVRPAAPGAGPDPDAPQVSPETDGGPDPVSAPAAAAPAQPAAGQEKGLTPASAAAAPSVPGVGARDDTSAAVAPAAASPGAAGGGGMPAGAVPGGAAARGGAGGSAGSAPVSPQKAMGAHPFSKATARPGQPSSAKDPAPPAQDRDHPSVADSAAVVAIPVSKERAERDAIAAASIADAEGRPGGGPDPVRLARRIAAALNAPGGGGSADLGFYWVTGVSTEGAIVVANSYGLAYIPDGVELPEPVQLASADDSIPVAERARWATYPVAAVQGWAGHRGAALRVVIATGDQFGASDAGAAKIVLGPEDIPEDGSMSGRPRLQVVNPDAAQLLSDTDDTRLTQLLPPAPAGSNPPPDRKSRLWFDVMKPMASSAAGREVAHLRAYRAYAAFAADAALRDAHGATEPRLQRACVADWLYWTSVTTTLDGLPADTL